MIRTALSFFVSGLVLALAVVVARQQARNYERAAELDRLQTEAQWLERECTELSADLQRLEFACEAEIEQTAIARAAKGRSELARGQE